MPRTASRLHWPCPVQDSTIESRQTLTKLVRTSQDYHGQNPLQIRADQQQIQTKRMFLQQRQYARSFFQAHGRSSQPYRGAGPTDIEAWIDKAQQREDRKFSSSRSLRNGSDCRSLKASHQQDCRSEISRTWRRGKACRNRVHLHLPSQALSSTRLLQETAHRQHQSQNPLW